MTSAKIRDFGPKIRKEKQIFQNILPRKIFYQKNHSLHFTKKKSISNYIFSKNYSLENFGENYRRKIFFISRGSLHERIIKVLNEIFRIHTKMIK